MQKRSSHVGMTVIEFLIAAGITTMGITVAVPFITGAYQQYALLKSRHETEDLKMLLIKSLDCDRTLAAQPLNQCPAAVDTPIEVRSKTDKIFVTTPFRQIGPDKVRAICQYSNLNNTITFQKCTGIDSGTTPPYSPCTNLLGSSIVCPNLTVPMTTTNGASYFAGAVFSGVPASTCDSNSNDCFGGMNNSGKIGRVLYDGTNNIHVRRFCQSLGGKYVPSGSPAGSSAASDYIIRWASTGGGGWETVPGGPSYHKDFSCNFP